MKTGTLINDDTIALWGWVLFSEYLNRGGITNDSQIHRKVWTPYNIAIAKRLFLAYYDKTWIDTVKDIVAPAANYVGLETGDDPKRLIEWCPDQAAIIRLGIGPYVETDTEVPKDVKDLLAKQLNVKI